MSEKFIPQTMTLEELEVLVRQVVRQELSEPKPYTTGQVSPEIWKIIQEGFIDEIATPSPSQMLREMRDQ